MSTSHEDLEEFGLGYVERVAPSHLAVAGRILVVHTEVVKEYLASDLVRIPFFVKRLKEVQTDATTGDTKFILYDASYKVMCFNPCPIISCIDEHGLKIHKLHMLSMPMPLPSDACFLAILNWTKQPARFQVVFEDPR